MWPVACAFHRSIRMSPVAPDAASTKSPIGTRSLLLGWMSVRPMCHRTPAAGVVYGGGLSTGFTVILAPKSPFPMNAPDSHVCGSLLDHTGSLRAMNDGQSTLSVVPPSTVPPLELPGPPSLGVPLLEPPDPLAPPPPELLGAPPLEPPEPPP